MICPRDQLLLLGQRVLGLVLIAQGAATVLFGARAPRWQMAFVRWGAKRNGCRLLNRMAVVEAHREAPESEGPR